MGSETSAGLHPIIRVISFLLYASCLALGGAGELQLAALLLVSVYLYAGLKLAVTAWPLLRRMRWLFLSLSILYLWFTPGTPLFPFGPSLAGIQEALLRISVLIVLALAASLLLRTSSRMQLVVALDWLVSPLKHLGLETDRFALRLVLSLETVVATQQLLNQSVSLSGINKSGISNSDSGPFTRIASVAAELFESVIQRAEHASCEAIQLADDGPPPACQWLVPLLLGGLFWLAA